MINPATRLYSLTVKQFSILSPKQKAIFYHLKQNAELHNEYSGEIQAKSQGFKIGGGGMSRKKLSLRY